MENTKQPHAKGKLCGAKTRSGDPCKNRAMPNGRCRMHGGKSTGAPKKNKNSEKHGLFTKYLPEESLDIFNAIEKASPIDLLWDQIKIQYAAIIRAQHIMHVKDINDTEKWIKKEGADFTEYEFQFAWDKQGSFLSSQSRAMMALSSMIEKYDKLCQSELVTEEQKNRIEKLKSDVDYSKAKIKQLTGEGEEYEDLSDIEGQIYG